MPVILGKAKTGKSNLDTPPRPVVCPFDSPHSTIPLSCTGVHGLGPANDAGPRLLLCGTGQGGGSICGAGRLGGVAFENPNEVDPSLPKKRFVFFVGQKGSAAVSVSIWASRYAYVHIVCQRVHKEPFPVMCGWEGS